MKLETIAMVALQADAYKIPSCEDGIHPIESECNGYYQCANGHRYPNQYCPEGLLFNKAESVCDWPDNVECEDQPDIEGSGPIRDEKPELVCEDGIHHHPDHCNAFYMCANGVRFPDQYCPEGLLFNGQVCDWPRNVNCNEANKPNEDFCEDGIYRHPEKCNAFYQCANGIKFADQYCPEGLLFNGQVCDWPRNVDCSSTPEDNEIEPEMEIEPELEQTKCADGIYRDPESCDSFYMCANGIKYPSQKCPDNLLFNGEVCDWPENVDCEQDTGSGDKFVVQF